MDSVPLDATHPDVAPLSAGYDHPVVDLPFMAVIDGRQYRGHGISLVSAHIVGLMGANPSALARIVRLVFDFDGFSVTLVVLADVGEAEGGAGELELTFTQPSGPHLPQLRHILNAYIAGDLVSLGEVIGVAGTTPPKPAAAAAPRRSRRVLQAAGLGFLTLLLVVVTAGLIYQRNYVQPLPEFGTVTLQGETLRATASGQIAFLDAEAAVGQVALAITTASGEVLSLTMPCDCTASPLGLKVGSTVLVGEPVLHLAEPGAAVVVSANVPPALGFNLARGDALELTLPDGTIVSAKTAGNPTGRALFTPDSALPSTMVGQPVQVRLIRDGGWIIKPIALVRQWLLHASGKF